MYIIAEQIYFVNLQNDSFYDKGSLIILINLLKWTH